MKVMQLTHGMSQSNKELGEPSLVIHGDRQPDPKEIRYGLIKGYCNHWFPLLVSLKAFFLGRLFLGNTGGLGSGLFFGPFFWYEKTHHEIVKPSYWWCNVMSCISKKRHIYIYIYLYTGLINLLTCLNVSSTHSIVRLRWWSKLTFFLSLGWNHQVTKLPEALGCWNSGVIHPDFFSERVNLESTQ